jgi:hypothetical protein
MILACLVLGLLAGGMLVMIGVSLVSFWKSLSPSDFQAWFVSHSHLVGRVMIPLGVGGGRSNGGSGSDMALDSYWTWGSWFRRGITSASSSMSAEHGTVLDAVSLAVCLIFVWYLLRDTPIA